MLRAKQRFASGNVVYASVVIRCPIARVFQFYRDFQNIPKFVGDVLNVEPIVPGISRWTVEGPLGIHDQWIVKVTEVSHNALICFETVTTAWRRARWEIHFSVGSNSGETVVSEFLKLPLGWAGRSLLSILGKSPSAEVPANLRRLKQVLETSCVPSGTLVYTAPSNAQAPNSPRKMCGTPLPISPVDPEILALRAALREGWLFEEH